MHALYHAAVCKRPGQWFGFCALPSLAASDASQHLMSQHTMYQQASLHSAVGMSVHVLPVAGCSHHDNGCSHHDNGCSHHNNGCSHHDNGCSHHHMAHSVSASHVPQSGQKTAGVCCTDIQVQIMRNFHPSIHSFANTSNKHYIYTTSSVGYSCTVSQHTHQRKSSAPQA